MATSSPSPLGDASSIIPYRINVSQRYLDLTKQKLELTRLPRDPRSHKDQSKFGTSKAEIEDLVDHWLERYDWRQEEATLNDSLPQCRTVVNGIRVHFVHKLSRSANVIPLLFVHGWPESFMVVSKVIDALCEPVATPPRGDENVTAFHVVAPSIPGFGFSDALPGESNNLETTAVVFHDLMQKLGHTTYMVHGSGWGFSISRLMALRHPEAVIAIHTVNPEMPAPRLGASTLPWLSYQAAKLTYLLLRRPAFGYTPEDLSLTDLSLDHEMASFPSSMWPAAVQSEDEQPQTISYALTDSPVGLLAYIHNAIKPCRTRAGSQGQVPQSIELSDLQNPWTPTALINWVMMYWLPGPEVSLRWLASSTSITHSLWDTYSYVPLGISHFREAVGSNGDAVSGQRPPTWAQAYHPIASIRRREGRVRFPAWERPAELVLDIRELAIIVRGQRLEPVSFNDMGVD